MGNELDYYIRRRNSVERQMADRRSKNARIQSEIQQLETAYNKLGNIKKSNYQCAKKVTDNAKLEKVAGTVQWRGKAKTDFDKAMKDSVKTGAEDFYKSIDAIHDEIGRALDAKRSEYDTGIGLLNSLNRTWNNLCGIIRNWTN